MILEKFDFSMICEEFGFSETRSTDLRRFYEFINDDAELERVKANYPIMWKDKNSEAEALLRRLPASLQSAAHRVDRQCHRRA